jgi:hypothetical protein
MPTAKNRGRAGLSLSKVIFSGCGQRPGYAIVLPGKLHELKENDLYVFTME